MHDSKKLYKNQKGIFSKNEKNFFGFLFIILFLSSCSNDTKIDSGNFSNTTPTLTTPTSLEISPPVSPTPATLELPTTAAPTITETPTVTPPSSAVSELPSTVMPTITETSTVTETPTITQAPTITETPTITQAPTITPKPTPTITQPPTPTATPTPLLLAEGEIPLSEEYFPDEAFRGLLSALVDTDKNGILTLKEREQLTELRNTYYDMEKNDDEGYEYYYVNDPWTEFEKVMYPWLNCVVSLEGIEYFPKLRFLAVDEGWERDEFYDFYDTDGQLKYLESFHAENMPELESVQLLTKTQNVTIKNAPKLRYLYLLPDQSVETCKVTLEDCNSVEKNGISWKVHASF